MLVAVLLCMGMQAQTARRPHNSTPLQTEKVVSSFKEYVETIPYLNEAEMSSLNKEFDNHISCLKNSTDKEAYITMHDLRFLIANQRDSIERYQGKKTMLIEDFLDQYGNQEFEDRQACVEQMQAILNDKLGPCETNLNLLDRELNAKEEKTLLGLDSQTLIIIGSVIGILLLILLIIAISRSGKKKEGVPVSSQSPHNNSGNSQDSGIVVRRKTATILKKQSLEGVIDNPDYMKVDVEDFCYDSAVRRIYIKNSCVEELYNMYVNDQEAPEKSREYGCMVLGRWVHDNESNEYYVSLEQIVLPGDDAQFEEYELNFGGKIKLKVLEELRKLRRETDMQYDMTCWVHSHPGLGVFFSNQDNTVHMQLKHPSHPHFLTAMVVDILTPNQELGIFTFKPDGTINAKVDLTQMYSLEEMYKWAIESERNTFKREDHFDTLAHAKLRDDTCHGVHLSNSAVIDIDKLSVEHENGMAGMVHGFIQQEGHYSEIAVSAVCHEVKIPDNELVGCFIITKYCSIPTVRKAIEPHMGKIRFAIVYSTVDGLLTTVPIKGRELMADEAYYGEQKLEELKIWTRRKR